MIEEESYNSDGTIRYKYFYTYDSYGNISEEIEYNKINELKSKKEYIYSK
jgi:hypothetical protein